MDGPWLHFWYKIGDALFWLLIISCIGFWLCWVPRNIISFLLGSHKGEKGE